MFLDLESLNILNLNNNFISNIEKDALGALASLRVIRLSGNSILFIDKGAFINLPRLP